MSKLGIRVISGVVGAIVVLLFVFAPKQVFHIGVAAACLTALYELQKTFDLHKKPQVAGVNYFFAVFFLVTPLLSLGTSREPMLFLLVMYLMLLLISSVLFNETVKFSDVSQSFFSLVYAVLFPLHLTYIRFLDQGLALIILVFLGAWMPDTFAYFAGSLLGRHKLIPKVSPKKTVEGAVGAVVGAAITFVVYGLILDFGLGYGVQYPTLIFLSLICGVVAQFGDLSASVIKRECGKKDFGNIIPGHGGMLDRIDSLTFIAPLTYYFLLIFEVIYK